jgi:vesicular inhibitory amino acid transporter
MSTLEILLGLDPPETKKSSEDVIESQASRSRAALRKVLSVIQRIGITCASVAVSIYIPQFSVMMAFLGSFSAFCLSIVGPIAAKVKIEGKCSFFDAAMMFMGGVMAVWGTIAAFK